MLTTLLFTTSASADINAVSDKTNHSIVVDVDVPGADEKSTLISIIDNGEKITSSNLPVFSYVYQTDKNGSISANILLPYDLKSGKYYVYADSDSFHESTTCMIVNERDTATQELLNRIESADNVDELHVILCENNNFEMLGFDVSEFDDNIIKTACYACLGEVLNKSDLNVEFFTKSMEKSIAYAQIKHGGDVEESIKRYASSFGVSYEEFASYSIDVKNKFADVFRNAELGKKNLSQIYEDSILIAEFKCAGSRGECKDIIYENSEYLNIDLSASSDFGDIKEKNQYKVFIEVYSQIEDINTVEEIKEIFDEAVDNVLDEQDDNNSSSSSSSSSGKSSFGTSSGASVSVPQSYEQTSEDTTKIPDEPKPDENVVFTDVSGHFSEKYVVEMAKKGIINGYADNTFKPEKKVTRAEISKMLCIALGLNGTSNLMIFNDVGDADWYYAYVMSMASAGYIKGYEGKFMPEDNISRQDMAVIISNILSDSNTLQMFADSDYVDSEQISDYALNAVNMVTTYGIMNGSDNKFRPIDGISRGEAAIVISRLLDAVGQNSVKGE